MIHVTVTQSCNTKKDIEGSRTNDIIYSIITICWSYEKHMYFRIGVINFIQLVSSQPVDRFSQTKLCWKAPNEGYPHMCGMYKSYNK